MGHEVHWIAGGRLSCEAFCIVLTVLFSVVMEGFYGLNGYNVMLFSEVAFLFDDQCNVLNLWR